MVRTARRYHAPMHPTRDSRPSGETLAEPGEVRLAGFFCVAGGGFLLVFYRGLWLRGIIPVPWLGAGLIVLGLWCLAEPSNPWLRRRVGRVVSIVRDPSSS